MKRKKGNVMKKHARKRMAGIQWPSAAASVVALVLVFGLLVDPAEARAVDAYGADRAATPTGPEEIEMVVTGLSCPFCAYGLEKRLRSEIEDLGDLEMEARTGKVTFRVEDGSELTDERLRKIVNDAGFTAKEIDRRPVE